MFGDFEPQPYKARVLKCEVLHNFKVPLKAPSRPPQRGWPPSPRRVFLSPSRPL
jgi:hypothetical protein